MTNKITEKEFNSLIIKISEIDIRVKILNSKNPVRTEDQMATQSGPSVLSQSASQVCQSTGSVIPVRSTQSGPALSGPARISQPRAEAE